MIDRIDSCDKENIIHQLIKVQADVTVTPLVKHGTPKVHCVDSCIEPHLDCHHCECDCSDCGYHDDNCYFTLTQLICVEVPICFDVDVDVKEGILCCGKPHMEHECKHEYEHDCSHEYEYEYDCKPDCRYDCNDYQKKLILNLMNNRVQF